MSNIAVQNALDRAIAKVAKDEFKRLRSGLSRFEVAQEVEAALNSLDGLSRGDMPEYDAWDALFYITWYQPRQVNLAYSLISKALENSLTTPNNRMHVVDFGCGAMAMRFGLALAVADLLKQGVRIKEIRLDMADNSDFMIDIGREVWKNFKRRVSKSPNLQYISRACEIITPRTNKIISEWGDDCWVSAIHTIYKDNKNDVQKKMRSLVSELKPSVLFTTTNASIESDRLLSFINPSNSKSYRVHQMQNFSYQFEGELNRVSNWRYEVRNEIGKYLHPSNIDMNFVQNYLKGSVKWDVGRPDIRLCTKR